MSPQEVDQVLAEAREIQKPHPSDTWVDKILLRVLAMLEKRLRAKRAENIAKEAEILAKEEVCIIHQVCYLE